MSDIILYLAMFITTIDKILCSWVPINWKRVIIFQSLIPSGTFSLSGYTLRKAEISIINMAYIFPISFT